MRISDGSSDVGSSDLTGGGSLEHAEAEYIGRASGYLKALDDFRAVPLRTASGGIPVTVGDVATVQIGPDTRRGIAELNGEGEVAGGVIVMREGKNAREVIDGVRTKLAELRSEEHTSELQSLMRISYAVFCLKKKKTNTSNK